MRTRQARSVAATLAALALIAAMAPATEAQVRAHRVLDAHGEPLADVLFDGEKAVARGTTRGFLVMAENLNRTHPVVAALDVVAYNRSALNLTDAPAPVTLEPGESKPLNFKLRARGNATAGVAHRVDLRVNLSAAPGAEGAPAGLPLERGFSMNITVSGLPTPLGETHETLSPGERAAGVLALAAVAALVGRSAYNKRRR